jgi:hypothetical protein
MVKGKAGADNVAQESAGTTNGHMPVENVRWDSAPPTETEKLHANNVEGVGANTVDKNGHAICVSRKPFVNITN